MALLYGSEGPCHPCEDKGTTAHAICLAQAWLPSWVGDYMKWILWSAFCWAPGCTSTRVFQGCYIVKPPAGPIKGGRVAFPGGVQIKQPRRQPPHQEGESGAASHRLSILPHISKCHTKYVSHMPLSGRRSNLRIYSRPGLRCMDRSQL